MYYVILIEACGGDSNMSVPKLFYLILFPFSCWLHERQPYVNANIVNII